jgi:hypothetical protein
MMFKFFRSTFYNLGGNDDSTLNDDGKGRCITLLIFNAGSAASCKLGFSSLFLAMVESESLRKPALNMSKDR